MKIPPSHEKAGRPASTGEGSDVASIADGAVRGFREIDTVLTPIIGHRGVVALFERSIHLSSRYYPWLAGLKEVSRRGMDLDDLRSLITQQSAEMAAAGTSFLLKSFHDLLASLVGPSLTKKWLPFLSVPPPQERST